jgi:acyl homoserine lactone synthase
MIEITQSGQIGKTGLLFDMHRLRAHVFKARMGWNVQIDSNGLEVDDYDLPETVYILALNNMRKVVGIWRLLPTHGPTMIRNIWPEFLRSLPMPARTDVWEASRFAVHSFNSDPRKAKEEAQTAIGELFCALTELCIEVGINEVFTLYDARIARVIRRLDCEPYAVSPPHLIDGNKSFVGAFKTNESMLQRIKCATGITKSVISHIDLPHAFTAIPQVHPIGFEEGQGHAHTFL